MFCREHVAQLRDAEPDIRKLGASIVAIGTGDPWYAQAFAEERDIAFPLLLDEELLTYRAVGAERGTVAQMVSPRVWGRGAQAVLGGSVQGRTGSHPLQLGATHIIQPDGSVPLAWTNRDFGDNAPVDLILETLQSG